MAQEKDEQAQTQEAAKEDEASAKEQIDNTEAVRSPRKEYYP